MDVESTIGTAQALVAPRKGILAADESAPTMARRLATVGLESTEPLRRGYREMLFSTPGLGELVSGVILFDETIRQHAADGTPFVELLRRQGVIAGIKVDGGTRPLAGLPDELVTEGLDGLRERLAAYAALGARFAKWRAVLRIGAERPTAACLEANAHALARYAALAQEAGLTPVVEPEVLMDGDHGLARCAEVTAAALRAVYDQLARHRVVLEGTLLKPNMVLPGTASAERRSAEEVAEATIRVLRRSVPAAVPGVVFLSGGQSAEVATAHLDAINRRASWDEPQPWQLSFSFGRALQAPVLAAWHGDDTRRETAQAALLHRAQLTSLARQGVYRPHLERPASPAA